MLRGIVFIVLLNSATLFAEEKASWELGAGVGVISVPDYRGSKESREYAFPIPYIRYHGKFVETDDGTVRGVLAKSGEIEFEISTGGSFTPRNKDNELRAGMPELGSAVELGPAININLSGENFNQGWKLVLPVRSVYAIGSNGIDQIGWVANPGFVYGNNVPDGQWDIKYSIKALYGNSDYNDYYYRVAPRFSTLNRPAYDANKGYSGYTSVFAMGRRIKNIWYGAFAVYSNLDQSSVIESPLVETDDNFTFGVGVSWIFMSSGQ